MSHRTRWSRVSASLRAGRLALIPLLGAVLWLALPGAALANYSTNPGWYWLNPIPAGLHTWLDVAMHGNEAWTTSEDALFLHSTDSGRTWQARSTDTRYLEQVTFVSSSVGWAVNTPLGVNPVRGVMRTTDGGQTWACTLPDPSLHITDLFCLDATHAWAQFGNGESTSYRTTDAGATWLASTTPCPLADVVFTSVTDGWSVGNVAPGDTIYHTTDAGVTWSGVRTGSTEALRSIAAPDAGHLIVGGADLNSISWKPSNPLVLRSSDHGVTWLASHPAGTGLYQLVTRLAFDDSGNGWAVSAADDGLSIEVLATTDGGASWTLDLGAQFVSAIACNAAGDALGCGHSVRVAAPSGSSFASVNPSSFTFNRPFCDLYFADGERGWGLFVTGSLGVKVVRTTDAGARWDEIAIPSIDPAKALVALCARSPSDLWAVGYYGEMAHSTDGGVTWASIDSTTTQNLKDITFADADDGWAAGGGSLISSVDAGQSWNPIYLNGDHSWSGVAAPTTTTVCVAGIDDIAGRGCVVRTTNGGDTWRQVLTTSMTTTLLGVAFTNTLDGWAWGNEGALYRTTSSGATWTRADLSGCFTGPEVKTLRIHDVAFTNASTGYVACDIDPGLGGCGYILTTTNGGTTWAKATIGLGVAKAMNTIATSGDRVWMAGDSACILANFDPDPDPPVTTESYDGLWANHAVTLDFTATDPGVGVAYTRFCRWPDPWVYGDSVTVPAPSDHSHDGVWPVRYQSVDWLAQAESPRTRLVKIDTVSPSDPGVALFPDPALSGGFVGPDPTFRFRGLDSALATRMPADSSMTAVAVAGQYALVGDGDSLVIFDVSNPWLPDAVNEVGVHGTISDVAVAHDVACVALGADGLVVVDVTDPVHPEVVGACPIDGDASRVSVDGECAYVATGEGGVAVVRVHDPSHPEVVAALKVEGATDIAADGDWLCVGTDVGMTAFDLSTPEAPVETGSCDLNGVALGVDLSDRIACVAAGTDGAYLIEVGGEGPEVLANPALSGSSSTAALSGDLAMVGGDSGVAVIDVSEPAEPVVAGTITTYESPMSLDAEGEYVYAAEGTDGLEIWKAMTTEAASYLVDGAPGTTPDTSPESGVGSASFSGLPGGPAYFHVRTQDQAGNWGPSTSLAFSVDARGPGVLTNADGFPHRSFTLVLTAYDLAGSGVASVEYRVYGEPWRVGTSVTFRRDIRHKRRRDSGMNTVEYRAIDRVGNVTTGSCAVLIL